MKSKNKGPQKLKKKLETLYNNPTERYGSTVNKSKHDRHIFGSDKLKANSSYFKNDLETLQKVIDEKAGQGHCYFEGNRLLEIITDSRLNGFCKSFIDGKTYATNLAKIHYSKTGVHLVPTLRGKEKHD